MGGLDRGCCYRCLYSSDCGDAYYKDGGESYKQYFTRSGKCSAYCPDERTLDLKLIIIICVVIVVLLCIFFSIRYARNRNREEQLEAQRQRARVDD